MDHHARIGSPTYKSIFSQFAVFAGVGTIGTIGHYIVLVTLVQAMSTPPTYASAFGFVVGALINYYLNYRYTFRSTKNHPETLVKFMLVAALGFLINAGIMYLGTEVVAVNYLAVQIASTSVILVNNFVFNKLWTFSSR